MYQPTYMQVSLYALLVLVYAALDTSWKIDDRRPGIVSLHARLGLVRYMHYSQVGGKLGIILVL